MPDVQTAPQPEPQAAPKAEVDEKVLNGLAEKYVAYRKADLKISPKFAEVCKFVADNQGQLPGTPKLERRHVINVLMDKGGITNEASARVEATHIMNVAKDANKTVLDDLLAGKITVAEARKLASSKGIAAREEAASEEAAKAKAAETGTEYVPPPKAEQKKGPGKPPTPFPDKVMNEVAGIVGRIIDANDPNLTEDWLIELVKEAFEAIKADRQAKATETAKKATAGTPPNAPSSVDAGSPDAGAPADTMAGVSA